MSNKNVFLRLISLRYISFFFKYVIFIFLFLHVNISIGCIITKTEAAFFSPSTPAGCRAARPVQYPSVSVKERYQKCTLWTYRSPPAITLCLEYESVFAVPD